MIHWFACGYRLVADPQTTSDPIGWLNTYKNFHKLDSVPVPEAYFAAFYWSASAVSLIGNVSYGVSPTCTREYIYATLVHLLSYLLIIYVTSNIATMIAGTSEVQQKRNVVVDNYLQLFKELRLDKRLKFTVSQEDSFRFFIT